MNRTSFAALALLTSFVTLVGSGCSSEDTPPAGAGATGNQPTAGTNSLPTAGMTGTPTAGSNSTTAGSGSGGSATAGSGGAATAGTSSGGTATGGASGGSATAGGGAGGSGTAGTSAGGSGNGSCPVKIESSTMCTAVVSCPNTPCGAFKLGVRDCTCAAAAGAFDCTSCTYKGTEPIVQAPAAALPACTADDVTLEKSTPTCTKGDRCKSLDTAKSRFCACWDDPVKGSTVWDCDSMPSTWPK